MTCRSTPDESVLPLLLGEPMHKNPPALADVLLAIVLSVAPAPIIAQTPAAPPLTRESLFRTLTGQWDWVHGDSTCRSAGAHTIAFSPDGAEMVLTFIRAKTDTGQHVYRYRITQSGVGLFPGTPNVLRTELQGETRTRSDNPGLVSWDLVLATVNQYHWHRTDWPDGGLTGAIARCDGEAPVDRWMGGWSNALHPIFRHTEIMGDTLRLGRPWASAERWGAGPLDTVNTLPKGAFGGADVIRVHRDSSGLIRQVDYAFLGGRERQLDEAVASYTAEIGPPAVERDSTAERLQWGAGWRDPQTELILVRYTPELNGLLAVMVLRDQRRGPSGK